MKVVFKRKNENLRSEGRVGKMAIELQWNTMRDLKAKDICIMKLSIWPFP